MDRCMDTDLSLFTLNNSTFQELGFVDMYWEKNCTPDVEEHQSPKDAFTKEETQNPSAEIEKLIESWSRTTSTDGESGVKLVLEEVNQPSERSEHFSFSEFSKQKEESSKKIKELKIQSYDLQSEIAEIEKKLSQSMKDYSEAEREVEYLRKKLESKEKEKSLLELTIQQLEMKKIKADFQTSAVVRSTLTHCISVYRSKLKRCGSVLHFLRSYALDPTTNLILQYQRAFIQIEEEEERLPSMKRKIQHQAKYISSLNSKLRNRCSGMIQLSDQMKSHIKKTWKFMTLFGVKLSKMGLLTDEERSDFLKEFGGQKDFYKMVGIPGIKNVSEILRDYSSISSEELSILHERIDDTSIYNMDVPSHLKDLQKSIVSSSVPSLPLLDNVSPVKILGDKNVEEGSTLSLVEFDSFDEETGCTRFSKVCKTSEFEQNLTVSSCSQEALENPILDQPSSDNDREPDSVDPYQEIMNSVENQDEKQSTPVPDHSVGTSVKYSQKISSELNEISSASSKALNPVNKMENESLSFNSANSDSRDNAMDKSNLCKIGFDSRRMIDETYEELNEFKGTDKKNLTDATVFDASNDIFIDDNQNYSNINKVETGHVKPIIGSCQDILNTKGNLPSINKFDPCISNHDANHLIDSCDAVDESNLCEKVFDSTSMVTDTCEELSEYTMKDKNNLTAASNGGFINGQNDSNINEVETESVESIVGPCQEILKTKEILQNKDKICISNYDANHFISSRDTMVESNLCKTVFKSTRRVTDTCEELSDYQMTDKKDLSDATLSQASNDGFIDSQNGSIINEVGTEPVDSIVGPCQDILNTKKSLQCKNKFSYDCISYRDSDLSIDCCDTMNKSSLCKTAFESTRIVTDTCEELSEYKMTDTNYLTDDSNGDVIDREDDSNINEVETEPMESIIGPCQEILNTKEGLHYKNKLSNSCISNGANHFIDSCDIVDKSNLREKVFDSMRVIAEASEEQSDYTMTNKNNLTAANNDVFIIGQNNSNINKVETEHVESVVGPSQKTLNTKEGLKNKNTIFISNHDANHFIGSCNTMAKSNLCKTVFESTRRVTDTCEELSEYKMTDTNYLTDDSNGDVIDREDDSNINEVETEPMESIIGPCQEILNTKEGLHYKNKLSNSCISNGANHFIDSCDIVDKSNLREKVFDSMRVIAEASEEQSDYTMTNKNNLTAANNDVFIIGQNNSNINKVETEHVESVVGPSQKTLNTKEGLKNKNTIFISNHDANHFIGSCNTMAKSNLCKTVFESTRRVTETWEELSDYQTRDKNNLSDAALSEASNDGQNDSNINEVVTKPVESIVGPGQDILSTKKSLQSKNKLSILGISNDTNHLIDSCGSDDDMDISMVDLSKFKHQLGLPNENFLPLSPLPPSPRKKRKSRKKSKALLEKNSDNNIKSTSKFSDRLSGLNIGLKPVSKEETSNLSLTESIDRTSKPLTIQNSEGCKKTTSIKKLKFSFSTKRSSTAKSLDYPKISFISQRSSNVINPTSCQNTHSSHNPLKVADSKTSNNKSKIEIRSVSAKRYSDGYIKLGGDASKSSRLLLNPKGMNVSYSDIVFQGKKIDEPNTAIKSHVTPAPLLKKSCVPTCKEENLNKCATVEPNIINPYWDVPGLRVDASETKGIMSTPLSSADSKIIQDITIPLKQTFSPINELQNATDPVLNGKRKKPASSVETSSLTLPLRVKGRTFQSRAFCRKRDKTENDVDKTAADISSVTSKEMDLEIHVDSTDIVCPIPRKVRKEHKQKTTEERRKDNSALQNQNCSAKEVDVTECVSSNNEKLHHCKTFNQSSKCLLLKSSGEGLFDSDQNEQLNSKETLSELIQSNVLPEIFSQNILDVAHNSDAVDCDTPDCLNNSEFSNCKEAISPLEKYSHLGLDSKCSTSNNLTSEYEGDCSADSIKSLAHSYNESVTISKRDRCRERSLRLAKKGKGEINGTYTEYLQTKRMLQDPTAEADQILVVLKAFEKMRSTDLYSKHAEQSLINALIDPKDVADKATLLFRVFQHLNTSKMKPLAIFVVNKDYSVLLPVDENCIVSVLFKIEEKKKVYLHKLLISAVNTLHQLVLTKEHFSLESLSSFCRVFTEICKRKRKPLKPFTLCLDLLKMKHKYAPYLIASVAGVWKELFEVSEDASDKEKVLHCAIAYGATHNRPKVLHSHNWEICQKLLSEVLTVVPDVSDIQETVEFLIRKIHEKCIADPLSDIEYSLITPLVICAVHTEWSWTQEHVLDKHVIPSLVKYGKEELNERAFNVFCDIYANIFSFCPGKPIDEILNKYFKERNTIKGKCSVRDSAALALIKILILQKKKIPDALTNWFEKNEANSVTQPAKVLFHLRTISERKELTQNDILQ